MKTQPNVEDLKQKASRIISGLSKKTESTAHELIEKGSELKGSLLDSLTNLLQKAQDELTGVLQYLGKDEIPLDEIQNGDLVVSPIDIKDNEVVIQVKDQVFAFYETMLPHIKQPLYKPTQEQLINFGKIKALEDVIKQPFVTFGDLIGYMDQKLIELKNKKYNEQQKQ